MPPRGCAVCGVAAIVAARDLRTAWLLRELPESVGLRPYGAAGTEPVPSAAEVAVRGQPLGAIANFASGLINRLRQGAEPSTLLDGAEQIAKQATRAAEALRPLRAFPRTTAPRRGRGCSG